MQRIKIENGLLSGREFYKEELKSGSSCLTNPDGSFHFEVSGIKTSKVVSILTVETGLLAGKAFARKDLEKSDYHLDCIGETGAFTTGFSFGFKS